MNAPSAKAIAAGLGVPLQVANRARQYLKEHTGRFAWTTLQAVEQTIAGHTASYEVFGDEVIPPGKGDRSPSIEYLNRGDTYTTTVLYLGGIDHQGRPTGNGRWAIGAWGDVVERGDYE